MKRIFFLILLGILVGIGGVGALGHFGKGPLAKMLYKGPPEEPPPPPPPPHRIVYLGEIITPIVRNHSIEEQIGIDIDVDVFADRFDRFNGLVALIDHRVRLELYDFLPYHMDTHSPQDRQAVHDRVQWIVENTVGPGVVREVTIRTFYTR